MSKTLDKDEPNNILLYTILNKTKPYYNIKHEPKVLNNSSNT